LLSARNLANSLTLDLLPELSQFEEMLIARVYRYMKIMQHRGHSTSAAAMSLVSFTIPAEFTMSCCFFQGAECLISLTGPSKDDPHIQHQFRKNYNVR
jgi:uncharacterized protein DUF6570